MKYKIHEKYVGDAFWTKPDAPPGYKTARTCNNCGKMSIASTYPDMKYLCNEVTEYTMLYDTGVPGIYSRQPFYTDPKGACDEHKFQHEMEEEE